MPAPPFAHQATAGLHGVARRRGLGLGSFIAGRNPRACRQGAFAQSVDAQPIGFALDLISDGEDQKRTTDAFGRRLFVLFMIELLQVAKGKIVKLRDLRLKCAAVDAPAHLLLRRK